MKADTEKIRRQLESGYNVISVADKLSPYTADLILVKNPPKRRRGTVMGVKAYFQSPESLILAKLRMIKATMPRERSQKDRDDIKAILANTRVDKRRIIDQAKRESTIEIFREILGSTRSRRRRKPAAHSDKRTTRRLKTGDKELKKKRRHKVASSREDVDRILH